MSNKKWKMNQLFVPFSEYLNFKVKIWGTVIWFFFFEDGTKLKIHSEITPPLKNWVVFQESLLPLLIFNRFQYSSSQYNMDASLHALVDLLYLLFWYLQLTCFLVPDDTMDQKSFWRQFFIYYLYSQRFLKMIHTTHYGNDVWKITVI